MPELSLLSCACDQLKIADMFTDRLLMDNVPNEHNLIEWPAIKKMLQPGMQIDVQFGEAEPPIAYYVIMTLDTPIIFCRSVNKPHLPEIEAEATPLIFIPDIRDLFSLRVVVKGATENGGYLALAPTGKAEFLRRRRSIRLKTADDISYRIQFEGKSNIYKGIAVQDISRGGIGLLVYAANPIPEGSQARIEITLPRSNEQVSAVGTVSHCLAHGKMPRMYRIGIQFTMISPHDKQLIAMYIDQLLKSTKAGQHT